MSILAKLDKMSNIEPRTKADGERRRTVSRQDEIGDKLTKAETVQAVGKLATSFGITEEEVVDRAKKAPNFGQWRMVLGNRIRGIARRMEEGMSKKDAAYPAKRAKAGKVTPGKKVVKKISSAKAPAAKKVIRRAPKAAPAAAAPVEAGAHG